MLKVNTQRRTVVLSWLMTIILCVGCIIVFPQYIGKQNTYNSGIHTQAKIIDIESRRGSQQSTTGTAEYIDKYGVTHEYYGFLGYNLIYGDYIDLVYDEDNPDNAVLGNSANNVMGIIVTVFLGLLTAGFLFISIMITFFTKGKKQIVCAHVDVDNEELARIVRDYMPQTRSKFLERRMRNKRIDKLGSDTIVERMLAAGDPIKGIYDNYRTVIENGDIYPCAVIRATDNDIYNQLIDINSPSVNSGLSRFTVPIVVVYSTDNYFTENPSELKKIADNFVNPKYDDKGIGDAEIDLINAIQNNNKRFFNFKYRGALSNDRDVFIATVILDKFHLCNAKLCNKFMYIVANPAQTQYAAILPSWYYSLWELSAF